MGVAAADKQSINAQKTLRAAPAISVSSEPEGTMALPIPDLGGLKELKTAVYLPIAAKDYGRGW